MARFGKGSVMEQCVAKTQSAFFREKRKGKAPYIFQVPSWNVRKGREVFEACIQAGLGRREQKAEDLHSTKGGQGGEEEEDRKGKPRGRSDEVS